MKFRARYVALLAALGVAVLNVTPHAAAADRFTRLNDASVTRLPPGLDTTPVTVMVILPGDPVAVAQEAAGRKLSRSEKDAIKSARKNDQDAIKAQIAAAGGTVLGSMQSAINAVKV